MQLIILTIRALDHSAHTLKGSISNFETSNAYKAALCLELKGKNKDLIDIWESFNLLQKELDSLINKLSNILLEDAA